MRKSEKFSCTGTWFGTNISKEKRSIRQANKIVKTKKYKHKMGKLELKMVSSLF